MDAASPAPTPVGAADWTDSRLAEGWTAGDRLEPLLALPRRIAASLIGADEHQVRRVVDVGSGPGAFLDVVLARCHDATGVWTDVSDSMLGAARDRLGHLAGRVDYRLLDARDLIHAAEPETVDAVVSSRVTHHLTIEDLGRFYAAARRLVASGGWIANLDHVALEEPWATRLTRARAELVPPNPSPHRHDRPLPALDDHLSALAGIDDLDVVIPWRAFSTVLVMARRA